MSHVYVLELTPDEVSAFEFANGRYAWATEMLPYLDDEKCAVMMTESEAWDWLDSLDGEHGFPLAAPNLASKLQSFLNGIV